MESGGIEKSIDGYITACRSLDEKAVLWQNQAATL